MSQDDKAPAEAPDPTVEPTPEAAPGATTEAAESGAPTTAGGVEAEAESEADRVAGVIAALQAEIAELKDRLLRSAAELENQRRRAEREKQDALKFGGAKLARDLLPVADNLRRAINAVPEEHRADLADFIAGVELTERELLSAFTRHDITQVEAKDTRFDPNLHEAMAEVPGTGRPGGTVIDVIETGYVMAGRLLRPARVIVAQGDAEPASAGGDTAADPASKS